MRRVNCTVQRKIPVQNITRNMVLLWRVMLRVICRARRGGKSGSDDAKDELPLYFSYGPFPLLYYHNSSLHSRGTTAFRGIFYTCKRVIHTNQ